MLRHDLTPGFASKRVVASNQRHWHGACWTRSEYHFGEAVMGTVTEFKALGNERPSATYANGIADGQSARAGGSALTLYLQVGIDDYARGFRAGFFGQTNSAKTVDER